MRTNTAPTAALTSAVRANMRPLNSSRRHPSWSSRSAIPLLWVKQAFRFCPRRFSTRSNASSR